MADKKSSSFIGKLVEDPSAPPQTTYAYGYLGDSAFDDHTRLYIQPDLSHFLDIPDDAILHQQDVPKAQNSLGAVHIWYRKDAQVATNGIRPQDTASASYLRGGIQQDLLGGQALTYVMQTNCPPATVCMQPTTLCPPTLDCPAQQ